MTDDKTCGGRADATRGHDSRPGRRGLSRRRMLAGSALLAAATVITGGASEALAATGPVQVPTPTPTPRPPVGPADGSPLPGVARSRHAVGDPRGSDVVARFGRAREARFGTMFKQLTGFAPDDDLLVGLSERMVEARGAEDDIRPDGLDNPDMPAGFIYLGQFIDHDMTRDATPLADQRVDPRGLTNFDTPRFDLGSVYGGGPTANPELYDPQRPGYLLLRQNANGLEDLPRGANGSAFVGDPRNDENLIIAQMQMAFIKLHNHFMDTEKNFTRARQQTRWHYQWVIVNDFLPHVVGRQLLDEMIFALGRRTRARTLFYRPGNPLRPMMPIEYSVAAYRWGHSGIRAEYEMHDTSLSPNPAVLPIFSTETGPNPRDLRGSRPLFTDATVDWNYFFDIPGVRPPDDRNMARLIDTQVARPLHDLPDSVVAHTPGAIIALAQRNLLRGKRLGLPSGQDVAAAMRTRVPTMPAPLTNDRLGLADPRWGGKAPLWFYCLREAELDGGRRLGPVGGRIVAEVILGLMQIDLGSYWNSPAGFTPVGGPSFRMGDLLRLAGAPVVVPAS
ncbi:MAG: heme peroxidase [Pseudonocardia sp.]|nr:heme peroxidase [Pseudonocardia sp.]MDT7699777.1 hypothetical protein [Pseudonocardiales bacterium]